MGDQDFAVGAGGLHKGCMAGRARPVQPNVRERVRVSSRVFGSKQHTGAFGGELRVTSSAAGLKALDA